MVYYETPGILLDVAYFFVFYYNEEYLYKRLKDQYNEEDEQHLRYYYRIKDNINQLPCELHPLAYSDDKRSALISNIIGEQAFQTITLDKFLDYIVSADFKKRVYQYWFQTTTETNVGNFDYLKLTPQLPISEAMKYKIIIFLDDYERYIKKFVSQL